MDIPAPEDFSKDVNPEVFAKPPANIKYGKPGQLTPQQVQQYFQDGYLIVPNYFDTSELEPVKDFITREVDCLADSLHKAGKISDEYKKYGLFQRLTQVEKEYPGTNCIFNKIGFLPSEVKDLWTNERLLNLAEQLLGTQDVQGHPIWNLRPKTPKSEYGEVPWHQDIGYTDKDSHKVLQLTAWIPFLDANENNGCMEVIRGGHKTGRVLPHYSCWRDTHFVEIMEQEMEEILNVNVKKDAVMCEVPYGGLMLFSNILPHRRQAFLKYFNNIFLRRSVRNSSDNIRWSIDLRWQRCDQPVAFHGLKDGVRFRSSSDPNYKIDWSPLEATKTVEESVNILTKGGTEFSSLVNGPWIGKWPIINENRHVKAYKEAYRAAGGRNTSAWHPVAKSKA